MIKGSNRNFAEKVKWRGNYDAFVKYFLEIRSTIPGTGAVHKRYNKLKFTIILMFSLKNGVNDLPECPGVNVPPLTGLSRWKLPRFPDLYTNGLNTTCDNRRVFILKYVQIGIRSNLRHVHNTIKIYKILRCGWISFQPDKTHTRGIRGNPKGDIWRRLEGTIKFSMLMCDDKYRVINVG